METLVYATTDQKPYYETTTISDDFSSENSDPPELPPDFPAESFYLPKENEFDWFDKHAFIKRNESTKGNNYLDSSITTPTASNLSSTISTSRRFSKASIIGLPKTQKPCYIIRSQRRNPNNKPGKVKFFPKRSRSNRNSGVLLTEPTSPKVSCMGRVRSKKERSRHRLKSKLQRNRSHDKSSAAVKTTSVKPEKNGKNGFWSNIKSMLHLGRRHRRKIQTVDIDDPSLFTEYSPSRASVTSETRWSTVSDSAAEPPRLGGLVRFASGRRTDAWVADPNENLGSLWHRRGEGPAIKEVDCSGRNWDAMGPTTV
ncbi:hypothetical protein GIB67_011821 [Kingdonia uniflora]|uniref:Uncharacterized protein n=1 Tax=Kingdonia uniflora TaxID=39325 RepID=A0A7J7NYA8_9MAGN|nr:hypothetical protein GIB67_011821 [Kingdonia uniflora]